MDEVMIVSVDGHAGPPVAEYRPYLEAQYHEHLDRVIEEEREFIAATSKIGSFSAAQLEIIDREGAIATGGLTGAWDLDRRLTEMDREGITAEIFLQGHQCATSPFFSFQNKPYPHDVRMAGAKAFNRWQLDMLNASGGRLIGVAEHTTVPDLEVILNEVRWAGENGFRATVMPGAIADRAVPRLPFHHPYWEPFWALCAEYQLAIVLHVGLGPEQGVVFDRFMERAKTMTGDYSREDRDADMMKLVAQQQQQGKPKEDDLFALNYSPREVLWQMMVGGVFDRYPNLHYVPTEARADWVPDTLAMMDARFERGGTPLKKRPSEYWASNCFGGASFLHKYEVEHRHEIGVDTLMFGRDYPHPEGTWPNTLDWLRAALAGVPEHEVRAILGGNAIRCYGLDAAALAPLARRVGPTLASLSDGSAVDPMVVREFDKRGGFLKDAPPLVESALADILDAALQPVAGQ